MFFQNEIDLLNPKKDEDRERLEDIRRKTTDWKVLKSVAEKLEIDETDRIKKLQDAEVARIEKERKETEEFLKYLQEFHRKSVEADSGPNIKKVVV
jgi:hypothetical protein